MNDLADSNQISIFELSPTPAGGILILGSENATSLEIFYSEQCKKYSTTILHSCFIQNLKNEIIPAYLSQNTPTAISNLGFFESTSLCDGLLAAQRILNENCQLIDFLSKTFKVFYAKMYPSHILCNVCLYCCKRQSHRQAAKIK